MPLHDWGYHSDHHSFSIVWEMVGETKARLMSQEADQQYEGEQHGAGPR